MDDGFGFWLAGLIDGEGCFTIMANRAKGRSYFHPRFALGLRADDEPVLKLVHAETGIGSLQRYASKIGAPGRQPQVRWVVRRKEHCAALVAILSRYPLRTKKARDAVIWAAAVDEWCVGRDPHLLSELKQQLEGGRRYVIDPTNGPTSGFERFERTTANGR